MLGVPATGLAAGPSEDLTLAAPATKSWAAPQIASVVLAGVMGPDVASFRPDDALTRAELHEALLALGKSHATPTDPNRTVTMRELDAQLVGAAGLISSARTIRLGTRDAGLEPTDMIGTETIARLLGLRVNHPIGSESLERAPKEPASRAEAAYSLAKLRLLDPGRVTAIRDLVSTFVVPELQTWQRLVLSRALRFVGFPYVFAGMSEKTQTLWSATHRQHDHRAGRLRLLGSGLACLQAALRRRDRRRRRAQGAHDLLHERRGRRRRFASRRRPSQPGDILFFGSRGPRSKPSEVGHSGIYVGNGWFVHSSSAGVTLQPLQGWYATTLAWARRPLAEAGLAS